MLVTTLIDEIKKKLYSRFMNFFILNEEDKEDSTMSQLKTAMELLKHLSKNKVSTNVAKIFFYVYSFC